MGLSGIRNAEQGLVTLLEKKKREENDESSILQFLSSNISVSLPERMALFGSAWPF